MFIFIRLEFFCMRNIFRIFIFIFLGLQFAQAQLYSDIQLETYSTEYYRIQQGLSQNSIMCILEDKRGFVWIGTWDGLNRFDGYDFLVIRPGMRGEEKKLSNETVNALHEDSEGLIWVGTDNGLNSFNPLTIEFQTYVFSSSNPESIGENHILSISEGKEGDIWVGTTNGLYIYSKSKQSFSKILFPGTLNLKNRVEIPKLFRSQDKSVMWVGTNQGLFHVNIQTLAFIDFSKRVMRSLPSDTITALFQDSRGNLWVGTEFGLDCIHLINDSARVYNTENSGLQSNHILSLMEDNSGMIWVGTMGGGVSIFNPEKNKFYRFGNQEKVDDGLTNSYIYSLLQTSNGTIWIGSWKGLNKFTPGLFRFKHIQAGSTSYSLNSSMVWAFLEIDQETMWVGTENGINVFNPQTRKIHYITVGSSHPLKLPSNKVRYLYRDSKKRIWIGTFDKGAMCYDPKDQSNRYFHQSILTPNKHLPGNQVWGIIEDKTDQSIWISSSAGVSRIMPDGRLISYKHDDLDKTSLSDDFTYSIMQDSKGNIWISTFSGANMYDRITDGFIHYQFIPGSENCLNSDRILSISEDSKGNIWFGTMGGGVNSYNPQKMKFSALTTNDGLANNIVYNIIEDDDGNIWFTTNVGLTKYNPTTKNILNYDVRDGVQSNEFNLGAAYKTKEGIIYAGGMNGFNLFSPSQIVESSVSPKVYITKFSIFNQKRNDLIENKSQIVLPYNENYFSFEFAALDYSNSKKINYAFKLQGFDDDWIYVQSDRRYADYTNIPHGQYVFLVKATNSDGVWQDEPIAIRIIIKAPFWKTLAFKIIFALVLTILILYTINS